MANKRISELNSLDGQISNEDLFLVQDVSPISESKSVSWGYLMGVIAASASVESASYSITSSFSHKIISASWASSSITSSFSYAASGSQVFAASSDWSFSSSYALTASYASGSGIFAVSSSYSISSSYSLNSSSSLSSSYAISASSASGSGVFAISSSYALSSSFASTASISEYSSNGIETGYMILYAGEDTDQLEATSEYLVCDGRDVLVSEYGDLYNSLGRKFGYYPPLTITATRTAFNELMSVYVDAETYHIAREGADWFSDGRDVIYYHGNGRIRFLPQSGTTNGVYTITGLFNGVTTSSVKVVSSASPTASFENLSRGDYRFIIFEPNTNSNFTFDVTVGLSVLPVTSSTSFGSYTSIRFSPSSNVAYNSRFKVVDNVTHKTSIGYLIQSSPASPITQSASLVFVDESPFTCSVIRYSGSYNDMPSASLHESTVQLEFAGYNTSGLNLAQTFSASFFIPNMGEIAGRTPVENIPRNLNPTNADISSSGYDYTFRYLIKT
jgi:hypothetical protein